MMKTFGIRLKSLREKNNLSQKQLAEKLQISNVQLSRYETGDRSPDFEMLIKIADYFGVSVDFLLGRHEEEAWNTENNLMVSTTDGNKLLVQLDELTTEQVLDLKKYVKFLKWNEE